jgi:hypothetical protein
VRNRHPSPRRGLPISELAFAIALVLAVDGLLSLDTADGRWATIAAMVIGLLAGTELLFRSR